MNTHLFALLSLLFLFSCASQGLKTQLSSSKEDVLSEESFMRYSTERHREMISKDSSIINQALSSCHQGKIEQGRNLLVNTMNKHRENPFYWNAVANCYSLEKNYPKALFYYDMSQALNNKAKVSQAMIHNNKAYILMKLRHFEQAKSELQEAIKLAPELKTPRYNFAQLNIQFGHIDLAEKDLRMLLRLAPEDIDVLAALGVVALYLNQPQQARQIFEKIPDRLRRREDVAIHYAISLYQSGEIEQSRAVLLRLGVLQIPNFRMVTQSLNRWIDRDLEVKRQTASEKSK